MNINLGCGDRYVEGWTNVDWQSPHRLDERVDLTGPLPTHWNGQVVRVYAGHLFEHITRDECRELARQILRVGHPDGCLLVVVGPDVETAEKMVAAGTFDWSWGTLDEIKYGAGRWSGDVHMWQTTGRLVAETLREAGWPVVQQLTIDMLSGAWPVADRGPRWQYAVRAWTGPNLTDREDE